MKGLVKCGQVVTSPVDRVRLGGGLGDVEGGKMSSSRDESKRVDFWNSRVDKVGLGIKELHNSGFTKCHKSALKAK